MKPLFHILLLLFPIAAYSQGIVGQDTVDIIIKKDTVRINGVFLDAQGDTAKINQVLGANNQGKLDWLELFGDSSIYIKRYFENYSDLRAFDTLKSDSVVVVENFQYLFNDTTYNTIGGVFYYNGCNENGATCIGGWQRVFDNKTYIPVWFEVGGFDSRGEDYVDKNEISTSGGLFYDGIYNDNDRLIHIALVAGEHKTIELGAFVNKYDIYIDVIPLKNQTWNFNGVELMRANSNHGELTSGEGSTLPAGGSLSITLDDVSGLTVGQYLWIVDQDTPYNGQGVNETMSSNPLGPPIISGISGNSVTITNTSSAPQQVPNNAFAVRQNVCFGNQNSDFGHLVLNDLVLNGNANNSGLTKWTATRFGSTYQYGFPADWRFFYSLLLGSKGSFTVINNSHFYNTPSENISFAKGEINNCTYENLGGSFLHISSALSTSSKPENLLTGIIINGLTGQNSNLIGNEIMGHSEALITFSAAPQNCQLVNARCKNGGANIIGDMASGLGKFIVDGSYFENFESILKATTANVTILASSIRFTNNTFLNCNDLSIGGNTTSPMKDILVSGNYFNHSRFAFRNIDGLEFTNNVVDDDGVPYDTTSLNGTAVATFKNHFYFTMVSNANISYNTITGPEDHDPQCLGGITWYLSEAASFIDPDDNDLYKHKYVNISHNTVKNHYRGIGEAGTVYRISTKSYVGWNIVSNKVFMSKSESQPNYGHGIEGFSGITIRHNDIFKGEHGGSATYPLVLNGIDDDLNGDDERLRLIGAIGEYNTIYENPNDSDVKAIYIGAHGNAANNQYNVVCQYNVVHAPITSNSVSNTSKWIKFNEVRDLDDSPVVDPTKTYIQTTQNGTSSLIEFNTSIDVITDSSLDGNGEISTPLKIAQQGALENQLLSWNGSSWVPINNTPNIGQLANETNWGIDYPFFIDTQTSITSFNLPVIWSGNTGDVITFMNKSGISKLINGDIDNIPSSINNINNGETTQFIWDANNSTWWRKN